MAEARGQAGMSIRAHVGSRGFPRPSACRLTVCFCSAVGALALAGLPAAARTLEIPAAEVERVEAQAEEIRAIADQIRVDFSSPQAMLESFEGMARTDMAEASGFGWTRDAAWGMEISGSWSASLEGSGKIIHWDMRDAGGGEILHAQLEDAGREAPVLLGVIAPVAKGVHYQTGSGDVGLDTIDNHFFEPDRVFGHARDAGRMRMPGFEGLDDMVEEFDQTRFKNARITVMDAGPDEEGAKRWVVHWTATLEEQDRVGDPTGRVGQVRGWMCDAHTHRNDPDACEPDDRFEVVDLSPPRHRENVSPALEHVEVTFSERADMDSLEQGFEVYTRSALGDRDALAGNWERVGDTTYRYILDEELLSGVHYVGFLQGDDGTAEPVRAVGTDAPLENSVEWRFTTLLDLSEQGSRIHRAGYTGGPFEPDEFTMAVDVYQVVMNPELTRNKPAMSRTRFDWEKQGGIDAEYQPDSFEMVVDITPAHSLIRGQKGLEARSTDAGPVTRIYRSEEFDFNQVRAAHDTINAFGWNADTDHSELEVTLEPHDPYPEPFEDAEVSATQPLEYWSEDPGDLTIHYAALDVGDWLTDEAEPLTRHYALQFADSLFEADGLPERVDAQMQRVVAGIEDYIPQFMPYSGAVGRDTGLRPGRRDLLRAQLADLERGLKAALFHRDACSARTMHVIDECVSNAIVLGAYMSWIQNQQADQIDPNDIFVIFVPRGVLGPGVIGMDLMLDDSPLYRGGTDLVARSVIVEVGYDTASQVELSDDRIAFTAVHEIAHSLGLHHNPGEAGEVGSIDGYKHPGVEAFRLDHDGMGGFNKSANEGNAERPGVLGPLMWPNSRPSSDIMTSLDEYERLQQGIAAGR